MRGLEYLCEIHAGGDDTHIKRVLRLSLVNTFIKQEVKIFFISLGYGKPSGFLSPPSPPPPNKKEKENK